MARRRGFTLIELLVVVAIIAVLMSILMPALDRVKHQVKMIKCQSNLHQWGLVMKYYTDDNDGFFMADLGHGRHAALSRPELKEYYKDDRLLLCPSATRTYEEGAWCPFAAWRSPEPDDPLGSPPCSYGINSWILSRAYCSRQTEDRMWKTPNISEAPYVPMVCDCAGYENASPWPEDEPPEYDGDFIQGTNYNEIRYVCINRHGGYINIVFMDFSVRKVALKRLWDLWWNRKWQEEIVQVGQPTWPEWMLDLPEQ